MKRMVILSLCVFLFELPVFSQVAINSDGTAADGAAMLDVKSTTKGILVPRMTAALRDAIINPATGLMIFCTDNNQYYFNKGTPSAKDWVMFNSQWLTTGTDIYYNAGNVGIGTSTPHANLQFSNAAANRKIVFYENLNNDNNFFGFGMNSATLRYQVDLTTSSHVFYAGSNVNTSIELMRIKGNGQVGIGNATPNAAAILDLTAITRGFLPPRMTTTQMNSIASPPAGLTIYNTTLKSLCWYDGGAWVEAGGASRSCGYVSYGGQTYSTVMIGSQCWMKENLNIGTVISGSQNQTNNGTIEKYCYAGNVANCAIYGGLYQWNECMNYTASSGSNPSNRQGICPTGWHLPSDAEWCQLEVYLDATVICSSVAEEGRGTDAGGKMKETGTTHWASPNMGNNTSGFTALPAGYRSSAGSFGMLNNFTWIWSTTESSTTAAWLRFLDNDNAKVFRNSLAKDGGYSVRCVQDVYPY